MSSTRSSVVLRGTKSNAVWRVHFQRLMIRLYSEPKHQGFFYRRDWNRCSDVPEARHELLQQLWAVGGSPVFGSRMA
jgi:hypothetical protein